MAQATYQKAITGNAYRNNGGTVVYGKTNSTITKVLGRTELAKSPKTLGPIAPVARGADLNFTSKTLSSGSFATMTKNKYVIKHVTTELAGVTNHSIRIGIANVRRRSNAYRENNVTLQVRAVTYDYVTGRATSNIGVSRDNFGADNAARVTRSAPGKLFINAGRRRAVTEFDYSARTD
jgi:hypothetical protein